MLMILILTEHPYKQTSRKGCDTVTGACSSLHVYVCRKNGSVSPEVKSISAPRPSYCSVQAFQEVHNTEQLQDGTPEVRGLHHIKVTLSFENEKVFFQRQSPSIFFSPSTDSSPPEKTL